MFSLPWFGEFGEHRKMQDVDKKRDLKEKYEEDWMGKKKKIQ